MYNLDVVDLLLCRVMLVSVSVNTILYYTMTNHSKQFASYQTFKSSVDEACKDLAVYLVHVQRLLAGCMAHFLVARTPMAVLLTYNQPSSAVQSYSLCMASRTFFSQYGSPSIPRECLFLSSGPFFPLFFSSRFFFFWQKSGPVAQQYSEDGLFWFFYMRYLFTGPSWLAMIKVSLLGRPEALIP